MGVRRKGSNRVSEDPEELTRVPLQAILLADSFAAKFRPITLERPKVLLPLVNVPMINYTLAWLESAGVEEVIVFCCAHSKQVIDYLESSEWFSHPNFSVTTIVSHNSNSVGEALRVIKGRNVINGDFVLISGDTVSNMSLTQVLKEHKERKKKDSNAVMTMVIRPSKPSPITHQSQLGTDELFMAIDPNTKQLLYYEDKADYSKGVICLDKLLRTDNPSIYLRNDAQDCYIDICSPEVLAHFDTNFDYQHLRHEFVKVLLDDDDINYKIFTHEIHSSYAARIDNFRSYDTISKDIIQRWTYPFVPDVKFFGNSATKLERQGMYRALEVVQSRSVEIGPFTVIGNGTKIESNTKISNSVVGEGCTIGSNVSIKGSYIWDNVIIEDDCKIMNAIVCDGVVMKSGAVLEPGVVLSFKVVVGQQFVVPSYSKVSLHPQPTKQDSDEEGESADDSSASTSTMEGSKEAMTSQLLEKQSWPTYELGTGGVGYVWSVCEGSHEEEWRHSISPIPADKLAKTMQTTDDDLELLTHDGSVLPTARELKPDYNDSDDDVSEHSRDDYFEMQVEKSFLRAVRENIKEDDLFAELNAMRMLDLECTKSCADAAGAIFYSMMKLSLETPHSSPSELFNNAVNVITQWQKLLKSFLTDIDDQIEVILKFEEMCLESTTEFSPLFSKILCRLYDKEIIQEDAILKWDDEKKDAVDFDKVFVKKSEEFIKWLREAPEEDDEDVGL